MLSNASFQRFLTEIEPSQATIERCQSARISIHRFLKDHEWFGGHLVRMFLAGSYARATAIRPRTVSGVTDIPDVDIMVVTNFARSLPPSIVLSHLAGTLAEHYYVKRTNRRSVRVETYGCQVDIVPLVKYHSCFRLPDRETDDWIYTNPPLHTRWSTEQNALFDQRFKPLVKMLKWWRRENISGKRPKGFVLEILVANHAPREVAHFGEAFAQLLENIRDRYESRRRFPKIIDPAFDDNDLLANTSEAQWRGFVEKVGTHARLARRAQDHEDANDAFVLWRRILGDRFRG